MTATIPTPTTTDTDTTTGDTSTAAGITTELAEAFTSADTAGQTEPASTRERDPRQVATAFLGELGVDLDGLFDQMEWAEQEIAAARRRHPAVSDRIFHSFTLLRPTHDRMSTEFVYRSHCTELLERVAADQDTRTATAAEICCAMQQVSLIAPMRSSATGLYMRMWARAGFPEIAEFGEAGAHHEALERDAIDDNERFARTKLAVTDRRLGVVTCGGLHHGESVSCAYAVSEQLTLPEL